MHIRSRVTNTFYRLGRLGNNYKYLTDKEKNTPAFLPDLPQPLLAGSKAMGVYVIAAGAAGPVKIGISRDPRRRLKELQAHSPARLRCHMFVRELDGRDREFEAHLHATLNSHRLHGEWFAVSADQAEAAVDATKVEFYERYPRIGRRSAFVVPDPLDEWMTVQTWGFPLVKARTSEIRV